MVTFAESMIVGVTGAKGFIGQFLVDYLCEQGVEVVPITRDAGFDILDFEGLQKIPKLDAIIHLAAKSYVPDSYLHPQAFFETNVQGTTNMLEIARQHKARFIFMSSYVYGNPTQLPTPESHQLSAPNPYAASKIAAEQQCNYFSRFFDVETFVLRLFNIYGPGQNELFLIPKIIQHAHSGSIDLFDAAPRRDYVHVLDVTDAIYRCLTATPTEKYTVFNVGSGVNYSVAEIVDMVKKHLPTDITVTYHGSDRPNEIMATLADITKIKASLMWQPRIDLETAIQSMLT